MGTNVWRSKNTILRMWRRFKANPKKIFLCKEFGECYRYNRQYLNLLVALGLIEVMPMKYKTGKRFQMRREVKGYRLINSHATKHHDVMKGGVK